MYKEKRKEKRLKINMPIKFKHPSNNSVYQTIMHDINKIGMKIMSKIFIENNEKIDFNLVLTNNGQIISSGHVMWIKPHQYGNGFYEIGIKFDNLKQNYKSHIDNFIKKHAIL